MTEGTKAHTNTKRMLIFSDLNHIAYFYYLEANNIEQTPVTSQPSAAPVRSRKNAIF